MIARSMLLVVPGGGSWLPNKVWENLRWLTDSEKDRLTEIALNTPKALAPVISIEDFGK